MAGDHVPGVQPHPDRDGRLPVRDQLAVEPVDLSDHPPRGLQRLVGVVLHRVRGAEDDQHAVALELVDVAAVLEDDLDHPAEVVVEKVDQLLRSHQLRQRREARDVGVEHRDLVALARQELRIAVRAREHVVGDLLVDVELEQLAQQLRALVLPSVVDGDRSEV